MTSPAPLWYYSDGFTTYGPFDASAIRQLKAAGVIRSIHFLQRQGDNTPLPLSAIDESAPEPATSSLPSAMPAELPFQLVRNGINHGAFLLSVLKEKLRLHEVSPEDLVWREGMDGWVRIGDIPELCSYPRSAPPLPPALLPSTKEAESMSTGAIIAIAVVALILIILTTGYWINHPTMFLILMAAACLKLFGKWIFKKF